MKSKKILITGFVLALLIQLGILWSFQYAEQQTIEHGKGFIVTTVPVDPRSLFRGDYVILNYEFSSIDISEMSKNIIKRLQRGQRVYVKLRGEKILTKLTELDQDWQGEDEPVERNWKVDAVNNRPWKYSGDNEIMLVGLIKHKSDTRIDVAYNIESYFVPEGEGKVIEKNLRQGAVKVLLAVDDKGKSSIISLFMDGKKVNFSKPVNPANSSK